MQNKINTCKLTCINHKIKLTLLISNLRGLGQRFGPDQNGVPELVFYKMKITFRTDNKQLKVYSQKFNIHLNFIIHHKNM